MLDQNIINEATKRSVRRLRRRSRRTRTLFSGSAANASVLFTQTMGRAA